MINILLYSFSDLRRSKWTYFYLGLYLLLGFTLLFLNQDLSKAIITLMNILLVLVPLISTIFSVMYYYNSRDFIELLLALPLSRTSVFIGQYLGLSLSLTLSVVIGLGIPFAVYGLFENAAIIDFVVLLLVSTFLNFIFVALAYVVCIRNENRIVGFGISILIWLILAILYDGFFLILLVQFDEYPLDRFALIAILLNPIDLSRTLILLKLDISALMGYTGAIFQSFLGNIWGTIIAYSSLLLWTIVPMIILRINALRKDF